MRWQYLAVVVFSWLEPIISKVPCSDGYIEVQDFNGKQSCIACKQGQFSSSNSQQCLKECPSYEASDKTNSGFFQACKSGKYTYGVESFILGLEDCPNGEEDQEFKCKVCPSTQLFDATSNQCVNACSIDQVKDNKNQACIERHQCRGYVLNNEECLLCEQQAPDFYDNYSETVECGTRNVNGLMCEDYVSSQSHTTQKCRCDESHPFRGVDTVSCVQKCNKDEYVNTDNGYKQCEKDCRHSLLYSSLEYNCDSVFNCNYFINVRSNRCDYICNGYVMAMQITRDHYINYVSNSELDENEHCRKNPFRIQEINTLKTMTVRVCVDVCFENYITTGNEYGNIYQCVSSCNPYDENCKYHSYLDDNLEKINCPPNYGKNESDYQEMKIKQIQIFPTRVGCLRRCLPPLKISETGEYCVIDCIDIFEMEDKNRKGFCRSCDNYLYYKAEDYLLLIGCSTDLMRKRENVQVWVDYQVRRYERETNGNQSMTNEVLRRHLKQIVEEWALQDILDVEDENILRYVNTLFLLQETTLVVESESRIKTYINHPKHWKSNMKFPQLESIQSELHFQSMFRDYTAAAYSEHSQNRIYDYYLLNLKEEVDESKYQYTLDFPNDYTGLEYSNVGFLSDYLIEGSFIGRSVACKFNRKVFLINN